MLEKKPNKLEREYSSGEFRHSESCTIQICCFKSSMFTLAFQQTPNCMKHIRKIRYMNEVLLNKLAVHIVSKWHTEISLWSNSIYWNSSKIHGRLGAEHRWNKQIKVGGICVIPKAPWPSRASSCQGAKKGRLGLVGLSARIGLA
jgi:hypothetical protein